MRIGITNNMRSASEVLKRVVQSQPGYEVAWEAYGGQEAVELAGRDTPDVILMELIMPDMDGAEATRLIMENSPCAILIVTATVEGRCSKIYEAMGHGALDVVATPSPGPGGSIEGARDLLKKIHTISRLTGNQSQVRPKSSIPEVASSKDTSDCGKIPDRAPLVTIGSSTGGPQALAEILSALPQSFPASIVLIQHVDVQFADGLASWLDERCQIRVQVAHPNTLPQPGTALLAATNDHLKLEHCGRLVSEQEPADLPFRPSVDVFLKSLVAHWKDPACAVLLTGMGRDGAAGLLAARKHGWHTIAQNEASSIVYGMPKAAAALNAAVEILPLKLIATRLQKWAADKIFA